MKTISSLFQVSVLSAFILLIFCGSFYLKSDIDINTTQIISEIVINQVETDFDYNFDELQANTSDSLKVVVDPTTFELPDGVFSAYLSLSIDEDDNSESLKMLLNNEVFERSVTIDITASVMFREVENYKLKLQNISNSEAFNDLDFVIRVDIVAGEFSGYCPMLPNGVALLEYDLESSDGSKSSKISYDFNSEEIPEDSIQAGGLAMSVFSYEMDKVLSKSSFEFVCTEEGALLSGFELGQLSVNQGNMIFIDMDIAWNTNYIPHYPIPGTDLDDAEVRMVADAETNSYGDYPMAFQIIMDTKVTDRKVVGIESVTVPAGTFSAYRIEFKSNTEFEFSSDNLIGIVLRVVKRRFERISRAETIVWYVRDLGFVKQESKTRDGTTRMELVNLVR